MPPGLSEIPIGDRPGRLYGKAPITRGLFRVLGREEDPLRVGLLALCIQQDCLEELLLNVKSERSPEGPLAP